MLHSEKIVLKYLSGAIGGFWGHVHCLQGENLGRLCDLVIFLLLSDFGAEGAVLLHFQELEYIQELN